MIIPMFDFRKYVIANFGLTGTGHVRFSGAFGVEEWSPEDVNTFTRKLLCWTISNPIADALQMVADAGDDPSCYTNLIFYCRKNPDTSQLRLIADVVDDTLLMGLCVNLHNDPYNLVTIAGTVHELAYTMRDTPHNYKELFVNYVIALCEKKEPEPMHPQDKKDMLPKLRDYILAGDDSHEREKFKNTIDRAISSPNFDLHRFIGRLLSWVMANPIADKLETTCTDNDLIARCRAGEHSADLMVHVKSGVKNNEIRTMITRMINRPEPAVIAGVVNDMAGTAGRPIEMNYFVNYMIQAISAILPDEKFIVEQPVTTALLSDIFGDTVPVAALMIMEGWRGSHANLMSILNRLAPLELEIGTDDALSHPYDIATERERNRCLAIVQLYMPDGSPLRNLITEAIETGKPV